MTLARILMAVGASAALSSAALAETVTPAAENSDKVDVASPEKIVSADRADLGEAKTVNAENMVELDDDFVLPTLNLPVDSLDDYELVDRNGKEVGEIEEVIGPDENTATAIAVEFDGPGWGIFDDDVTRVVDISKFSIEGDALIVDIAADDIRQLPVYDD